MMVFPDALGEVTPTVVALLFGLTLGMQMECTLSRRTVLLVLFMSLLAAFLFEAPIHSWSLLGGVFGEHVSFALPFVSATLGILIGNSVRRGGGA